MWSIVFPIGMYGVGTREFGPSVGESWMATFGRAEAWVGLAAWVVVVSHTVGSDRTHGLDGPAEGSAMNENPDSGTNASQVSVRTRTSGWGASPTGVRRSMEPATATRASAARPRATPIHPIEG